MVSARLGPYQIAGRLGAGGMGEVYRAWDTRLRRHVAVKVLRPEAAHDPRKRQRLWREARAIASLNHPAIVQVHDVLESDDGVAIVMEVVDGVTLAERLEAGPLDVAEALRAALQITEGLAAAHAMAVVHRDLKPRNVMLTRSGQAKILDFGLAKLLEVADGDLSQEGAVIGTCCAMSPEQARGLPVDHRSDLFSLGTLLYEMFTGRSPFAGQDPLDTLQRVCTLRQPPAIEIRPGLPAALSDLIDRLLEKSPSRRPRSSDEVRASIQALASAPAADTNVAALGAAVDRTTWPGTSPMVQAAPAVRRGRVAAAAVAVALAAAGIALSLWPRAQPLYVAVPRPELASPSTAPGAELLSLALREALLRGLLSLRGVLPLAPEHVDPAPGPPAALARATAADEVVTSRLDCAGEVCRVSLSRVAGRDGALLWTQSFDTPLHEPLLLAEATAGQLALAYPDRPPRSGAPRLEAAASDYAEYLRAVHDFSVNESAALPFDAYVRALARVRTGSPRFVEAYLAEARAWSYRFSTGRDPGDLERAFELIARARDLSAGDPRPTTVLADVALNAGRLDTADAAVGELERLQPGSADVAVRRARILARTGQADRALAVMRDAVERHPAWPHLFRLASLENERGQAEAAKAHLQEVLRRFPGYYAGQSLWAQIELLTGSPEKAAELYAELVARAPQVTELTNLGLAHLLLRQYGEAERRFRAAAQLEPLNAMVLLNLADAVLLQGRTGEAEPIYAHVLALAQQDPAAAQWQLRSVQGQALAHLGRHGEAVEAVQSMLAEAAANPQASYEASLVYTLAGDRTSGLLNARKALDGGVEARWFTFPWFDPLRASPDFQRRLAARPR